MVEHLTVHDAIAAGHARLEVRCEHCRVTLHIPWGLMKGVLGNDRIDDLHRRLVCRKCGERPEPRNVRIPDPVKVPGM